MENEKEIIKRQMEETRTSLTDKLGTLEHQLVETVQGATAVVEETVESLQETVQNVRDTVEETVGSVKDTVQDTVDSVKDTFDLGKHVERHPWAMVAGATAVGFVTGYLLAPRPSAGLSALAAGLAAGLPKAETPRPQSAEHRNGASKPAPVEAEPQGPSLLSKLGDVFQNELSQFKGLAVGTVANIVRDLLLKSMPEQLKTSVEEMINDVTVKMGGQVIPGHILPESEEKTEPKAGGQASSGSKPYQFEARMGGS